MHVNKRLVAAASLWFAAIIMMTLAVSTPNQAHLAGWAILAAVGGSVPALWLVVDHVVAKHSARSQQEVRDIVRLVVRDLHSV